MRTIMLQTATVNNWPHRLMKTSSIAVETSRSTTQSDSIVRQTNKRSSYVSWSCLFLDIIYANLFHFQLTSLNNYAPQNWGTKLSCAHEPWQWQVYNDAGRENESGSLWVLPTWSIYPLFRLHVTQPAQLIRPSSPKVPYRGEIASTQPYTWEKRGNEE